MARRFIPFGSHWRMGIEVPYSLGVVDRGRFWSCGQCPLDLDARVLHPGDLKRQLACVAALIRAQFEPYGITPDRIAKLVAYVAPDESTPPAKTPNPAGTPKPTTNKTPATSGDTRPRRNQ